MSEKLHEWSKVEEVVKKAINSNICKIVFNKITDNTDREMYCTTSTDVIKMYQKVEIPLLPPKRNTKDLIQIFDIEHWDWRSFKMNQLKSCIIPPVDEVTTKMKSKVNK